MNRKTGALMLGLCAAAMLYTGIATAQERERGWGWMPWGMPHMFQDGWGPRNGMGGWGADFMIDRVDGRLAYMKAELKITDDQTAAWDSFAEVVRTTAESHNAMMRSLWDEAKEEADKPLPERLSLHISLMETRLEQMKSMLTATNSLYEALTDDQRKAADDIVLPMMGMGTGRWMMGR